MRKLLFALSALAALFMIAPSNGYAQYVYQSMVGLYQDDSVLDVHTGTTPGFQSEDIYIVLTNPYLNVGLAPGESGTVPVTQIKAFDLRVTVPTGHTLLGLTLPVSGTILGDMPDFAAGLSTPLAVVDHAVTLGSLSVFVTSTAHSEYFLGPVSVSPEIEGHMAAVDGDGNSFMIYPVSGDTNAPVFIFNADSDPVATEDATWSDVKALYR